MQDFVASFAASHTLDPVASVAGPLPGGPHLLEAALGPRGASGATAVRQRSARGEALGGIGWRHSTLALGNLSASSGHPLSWLSAARWWFDRSSVAHTLCAASPDIIETAEPFVLGGAVLDAADRLGVPAVALCRGDPLLGLRRGIARSHGLAPQNLSRRGRWVERRALGLLHRVYEGYDLVLAPSRSMAAQLQSLGVAHAAYQPIGIDCAVFTPNACDHAWRRVLEARLHLTPGTRLVLYVGHFGAGMPMHWLVDAVRRLGPGHALLALGEGPFPPSGDAVHCLPSDLSAPERARLMASCDALVHAGGETEQGSLAVLEAMACGLSVVASNTGAHAELIAGAGIAVASTRVEDWAEALSAALGNPSWAHFWAALERARSHDWGLVAQQQARLYRQAIGELRPNRETLLHRERVEPTPAALSH